MASKGEGGGGGGASYEDTGIDDYPTYLNTEAGTTPAGDTQEELDNFLEEIDDDETHTFDIGLRRAIRDNLGEMDEAAYDHAGNVIIGGEIPVEDLREAYETGNYQNLFNRIFRPRSGGRVVIPQPARQEDFQIYL